MKLSVWGVLVPALLVSSSLYADDAAVNDIKGKISNATVMKQMFAKGAKFCGQLDGTSNFYFEARDRVLSLDDYHRSLLSLAKGQVYNPETHKPWTDQDADKRWDFAQKEAARDKANCDLIASLPFLQKKLQELENQSQTSAK